MVRDIGAGDVADAGTIVQRLMEAYRVNRWTGIKEKRSPVDFNGGDEAAVLLLKLLHRVKT
jgi:hypothetical protein